MSGKHVVWLTEKRSYRVEFDADTHTQGDAYTNTICGWSTSTDFETHDGVTLETVEVEQVTLISPGDERTITEIDVRYCIG